MNDTADSILIVFATNTQIPSWMEQWAYARRAGIYCSATAGQALHEVVRRRPDAVVVCFDGPIHRAESVRLVSELRRRRPNVTLVALASSEDDQATECAARGAGAHLYFAGASDLESLDASLAGLRTVSRRRPRPPPRVRHRIRGRPPPTRRCPVPGSSITQHEEKQT